MKVFTQGKTKRNSFASHSAQPTRLGIVWLANMRQIGGMIMTRNQIALAELRESHRHNVVSERHEHKDVQSRTSQAASAKLQAETAARQATINWWSAQEQARHNLVGEQVDFLKYGSLAALQQKQGDAALTTASASAVQAETSRNSLLESIRHNTAIESLTQAQQSEMHRANVASESARAKELRERIRSAKASESLTGAQIAESRRHSTTMEALSGSELAESIRHNAALENVSKSQATSTRMSARAEQQRAISDATRASASKEQAEAATSQAKSADLRAKVEAVQAGSSIAQDIMRTVGGLFS
nr:putative ORF1 [Marmot picobirnavirus]